MPKARKEQISISDTPYYHCVSRCVRRAFLYGIDPISGKNYEHRKEWIVNKLAELAHVFSIEVYAYSVMANHTHLVLKINTDLSKSWSEQDVVKHWHILFSLPVLIERYLSGDCKTAAEQNRAKEIIEVWRERLTDISWFMRCLNEFVARKANAEDKCTGRFWEGRFKSQALLSEQALLACMSYVDLNPVRANISDSLEDSDYTSIQQRIKQLENKQAETKDSIIPLAPFIAASQTDNGIPFPKGLSRINRLDRPLC